MVVVGGADEAVIGDVHQLPQIQHAPGALHDIVHKGFGLHARLPGLVLDLLAVLVGAGEEKHVAALQPFIAGHGVGGHGTVGVADVELIRGVIDGRGDIKCVVILHQGFPPYSNLLFQCPSKAASPAFAVPGAAGRCRAAPRKRRQNRGKRPDTGPGSPARGYRPA